MPPKSASIITDIVTDTVDYPYDYGHLFYIDTPTTKWNSKVLYHIFKCLGVENLSDFLWDPTECGVMYAIKDQKVYKCCSIDSLLGFFNSHPLAFHPDIHIKQSLQNEECVMAGMTKLALIAGIDNWIQQEAYNGQIFGDDSIESDRNNTKLLDAMVVGFAEYCESILYNTQVVRPKTIERIAGEGNSKYDWARCIDKETGKICKPGNYVGDYSIHTSKDAFRYITINVSDNTVYIEACTSFAKTSGDGRKTISVGRRHGAGYWLVDYPMTPIITGYKHCPGKCMECEHFCRKISNTPENLQVSEYTKCNMESVGHTSIINVGGLNRFYGGTIYPTKKDSNELKTDKKSVYNNTEGSSAAKINSQTKNKTIMATTNKNTGLFERMLNKYKGQLIPVKIDGLSLTMDGNIALPNGQDEYIAIVDDHLENYPVEAVIQDIPFYSVQRPLEQVKVGDYVFLTTTAEGRKLAKVTYINKTKEGKPKGLTVLRFSGSKDETAAITDKLTGLTTVEVVVNMFDGFRLLGMGGNGQGSQMNPLMMLALMKDGGMGDTGLEKLMTMSFLMGGNGGFNFQFPGMGGNGQMNPLLMLALMKDGKLGDSGLENMFTMAMMMGGNNPFACMQQAPAEQTPARKTRSDKGTSRKPADDGADTTAGKEENAE